MKRNEALKKAKTFDELLDLQYGKRGANKREQFEEKARNFVTSEINSNSFQLTEGQIAGIKSGLADVKAGRLTSNEDFQKELDEWLSKEK
jgi:predicted transcriptional regulator